MALIAPLLCKKVEMVALLVLLEGCGLWRLLTCDEAPYKRAGKAMGKGIVRRMATRR